MIKVGLIERHPAMCIGLRIFLEERFDDVTVFSSNHIQDLATSYPHEEFDIIILSVYDRSETSHLSRLTMCLKYFQAVPVVVYADSVDATFVSDGLRHGLKGFLVKEDLLEEVEHCVNTVLKGRHYLNPSMTELFLNYFSKSNSSQTIKTYPLTTKEKLIAKHLITGMRSGDIAKKLNLKSSTISTVKRTIFKKTKVENIIDLKKVIKGDAREILAGK